MKPSSLWIVGMTFAASIPHAHAQTCGVEIGRLKADAASSTVLTTAPTSIGPHRQPTPSSVERAQQEAQSNLTAALDRAQALDQEGKSAECLEAVKSARRMLLLPD
jgi:hypothetical protein